MVVRPNALGRFLDKSQMTDHRAMKLLRIGYHLLSYGVVFQIVPYLAHPDLIPENTAGAKHLETILHRFDKTGYHFGFVNGMPIHNQKNPLLQLRAAIS